MDDGEQLCLAAISLIGTRFRLHGRDPRTGLDCIGLVLASLKAIGRHPSDPRGYRLRNSDIDQWLGCALKSGLVPAIGKIAVGDVLLIAPSPGQHHLCITESPSAIIHAHAGLRRVVRQPWNGTTPALARWRLVQREGKAEWPR